MATLSINSVRKSFGTVEVLSNIDIDVEDGGFLVLLGPSGCGKSTLLAIIAGLETSSGGDILIGDRNVNDVHPKDRNIAMVFQSYALYPTMPVRRNIGFGLEMRKVDAKDRDAAVNRAAELLQIEHLLDRKPGQLSGGQRQRVAMGRAIVRNPDLFLFDEPLSNLDAKLRVEMRTEIKRLHERLGTTTVYVTHDQVEALTLGTKVAVMKDGVIQQLADPETIYERPANMFVASFIGSPTMNFLKGTLESPGGSLQLRYDGGTLALPDLTQDVAGFVGRTVVAGIRPETLHAGPGAATLTGAVDIIEPTGPDTMVIVNVGGQLITARLGPKARPVSGQPLTLAVDSAAINLFDPDTGNRI
ncbi:MAG: sugar transporter, ATP-binding protein [Devosia sp.]|uniref:ABC transporter ATP-binding protein n=1 Tax=Devosia sp. TaxID=1871048 RepID=UPI002614BD38|nr:sn-glycerol-3-phosphate ABC transporter ATP-binding protein UgpC [Devosia sp.]MDB5586613.1 sugar transporter, ATP-binding protein [Devosia sp.]